MNVQAFLEDFRVVANAPDGVAQLRRMILTMAVQGRLVPQTATDQPASDLLNEVALQRNRIFSPRPPSSLHSPPPIHIPKSWCWARFEDIAEIRSNLVRPSVFPDMPHLAPDNIEKATGVLLPCRTVREDKVRSANHRFFAGQIVYSKIRPNLSKVVVVDFDGLCSADMYPITSFIFTRYLFRYMLSEHFLVQSVKSDTRVAMPKINQAELNAINVPVPPLEEQKRIVAKVDELMRLCDRLEAQQQERAKLLPVLSRANRDRFVASPTPANLQAIFHEPGTVSPSDLRQTILALAVTGRLAEQDSNDESVDQVFARIQAQRNECGATDVAEVSSDEAFFAIPQSWKWVRLGNIATHSDSGWSPQCRGGARVGDEWGVLKVSAVSWGRFQPEENKALPASAKPRPECEIRDGDLLMSRANTFELIAKSVIADNPPPRLMMSDKIVRFHFPDEVDKSYVNLFNLSPWARQYYAANASGTSSSMKNVSRKVMNGLPVPFPPTAEQRRIVSRVRQLMSLIDRLEDHSRHMQKTAESFAKWAVAAITSTDSMESDNRMAPTTEIITALKVNGKPKKSGAAPLAALLSGQKGETSAKALWQLSGLEIDDFYRQLKIEMANGWIVEPTKAFVKEVEAS